MTCASAGKRRTAWRAARKERKRPGSSYYGVRKAVENLPALRQKLGTVIDAYLTSSRTSSKPSSTVASSGASLRGRSAGCGVSSRFRTPGRPAWRGRSGRASVWPTVLANGKRLPGLKLNHPRLLALMHALVRFAHIPAGHTFTTRDLYAPTIDALGTPVRPYTLASLRYDLAKLRAKDLVEKLPRSRRYRLRPEGYRICLVFLKLFERVYAPLTAGLLDPFRGDTRIGRDRRTQLDRLYQRVNDDLDHLLAAVGLKVAA